jgi:hypothetical protein
LITRKSLHPTFFANFWAFLFCFLQQNSHSDLLYFMSDLRFPLSTLQTLAPIGTITTTNRHRLLFSKVAYVWTRSNSQRWGLPCLSWPKEEFNSDDHSLNIFYSSHCFCFLHMHWLLLFGIFCVFFLFSVIFGFLLSTYTYLLFLSTLFIDPISWLKYYHVDSQQSHNLYFQTTPLFKFQICVNKLPTK